MWLSGKHISGRANSQHKGCEARGYSVNLLFEDSEESVRMERSEQGAEWYELRPEENGGEVQTGGGDP